VAGVAGPCALFRYAVAMTATVAPSPPSF
jgi:hypothetical protein